MSECIALTFGRLVLLRCERAWCTPRRGTNIEKDYSEVLTRLQCTPARALRINPLALSMAVL